MEEMYRHQMRELERYQEVAGDFAKVKACQVQMESRIGANVPVRGREFASIWSALDYGVRALDSTIEYKADQGDAVVAELSDVVKQCEQMLEDWKTSVTQGFQEFDAVFGKQMEELEKQQKRIEVKIGGHEPRIRGGILFHPRRSGEGEDKSEGSKEKDPLEGGMEEDTEETLIDLRNRLR